MRANSQQRILILFIFFFHFQVSIKSKYTGMPFVQQAQLETTDVIVSLKTEAETFGEMMNRSLLSFPVSPIPPILMEFHVIDIMKTIRL